MLVMWLATDRRLGMRVVPHRHAVTGMRFVPRWPRQAVTGDAVLCPRWPEVIMVQQIARNWRRPQLGTALRQTARA